MNDIHAYIDQHAGEAVGLLQEFCRQPSIAAQGHGMDAMARLVQRELAFSGADPELVDTRGGFLVVYGRIAGQSDRTSSFYNHYDVQPPDPLDEWDFDPWAAEVRDGRIYARGVADDRGETNQRRRWVGAGSGGGLQAAGESAPPSLSGTLTESGKIMNCPPSPGRPDTPWPLMGLRSAAGRATQGPPCEDSHQPEPRTRVRRWRAAARSGSTTSFRSPA